MVALQKPNGRVRVIVVSDFFRRPVARSHFAATLQEACVPFQFGLFTRAGAETVAHALSFSNELDPDATVLSVDMLYALRHVPGSNAMLPFVRQFYASPSRVVWHDAQSAPHMIFQAEGGEQGDPLMPAQHGALVATQRQRVLALWMISIDTSPDRVRPVFEHLVCSASDALPDPAARWQSTRLERLWP